MIIKREGLLILITTRCNMTCKHCAISAAADGVDMTLATFSAVCAKVHRLQRPRKICLSGGEPLLHPDFFQIVDLMMSAAKPSGSTIQISTNGSLKEESLQLLRLATAGSVEARLSATKWHHTGMVDPKVREAFTRNPNSQVREEFLNLSFAPSSTGRAADWGEPFCYWSDYTVNPDGSVFPCGCRAVAVGSVFDDFSFSDKSAGCVRFSEKQEWVDRKVDGVMKAVPPGLFYKIMQDGQKGPAFAKYLEILESTIRGTVLPENPYHENLHCFQNADS